MSQEDYKQYVHRLVRLWVDDYTPSEVMTDLRTIVGEIPCFVLTTNADEHLEKAGFPAYDVWEIEGTFRDLIKGGAPENKQERVNEFLTRWHGKRIVLLELGIGSRNRLIKLPMMQLTAQEQNGSYVPPCQIQYARQ
ncbi:MAG: hypothetical protein K2M87_02390 [Muribaculaceae bacterium]|nr:hypothetical protein [Muribaculaceae bacterium]